MKIIPKLDAGPFMMQKSISIKEKDNFQTLSSKLSELSSKLILEALSRFENNQVQFENQQDKLVTYAKKIDKKESEINWGEPATKLIAKINGLNPYPGVWFKHNNARIKIIEAEVSKNIGKKGEVLTDDLTIGCLDKSIKITLLQKEGKKTMDAKSFLSGYKISKGEILS